MILKEFTGTKCFACGDEMNFDYPAFIQRGQIFMTT
jgi:DNA-directed RNA polymerase subunit N (RpoN/RPB10)